jgi:predicted N-acetyltransferase YhbS
MTHDLSLIPACECKQDEIQIAASLLAKQWTRGGSVSYYESKISGDRQKSSPSLPCSFLLFSHGSVVAHGRLIDCFEGASGNAAAATFIISEPRGHGYGSALMRRLEVLEEHAVNMGYHYIYLWTTTAVKFYRKMGYTPCERVSLYRECLKKLEIHQVSRLEAMLSKKAGHLARETILLPPDEGRDGDVWMRKRLVEFVGSQSIQLEKRLEEIRKAAEKYESDFFWEYLLNNIPWQQQIGPSCGLAALRMLRDHYHSNSQMPSLLQEALEKGYTVDGEIFDLCNMMKLSEFCGLDCELQPFPSVEKIVSTLRSGGSIIFAYDLQASTRLPCKNGGKTAHYGLIIGILFAYQRSNNNNNLQVFLSKHTDSNTKNACKILLLVLHGLSSGLSIASYDEFLESNRQLFSFDIKKYKVNSFNLKGHAVVCYGEIVEETE